MLQKAVSTLAKYFVRKRCSMHTENKLNIIQQVAAAIRPLTSSTAAMGEVWFLGFGD